MLIPISYPLTRDAPLYPGTPGTFLVTEKSMERGDRSNTTTITMSAHSGTHLDLPRHFCRDGETVLSREIIIEPVYCVEITRERGECLRAGDFPETTESFRDARGLLVRTGWFRTRCQGTGTYTTGYPWVEPDLAEFLRARFPDLRLFGIDTVSIALPSRKTEGSEAHRAFLCGSPPILLLEDADLSDPRLLSGPLRLRIFPWLTDAIDGVPVTALAGEYP
jgi:kynurenine formamidase